MMKAFFLSTFLCLLALPSFGGPMGAFQSKKMVVAVTQAYVPSGFDSKSEQMVVVNGFFPNGCYSFDSVAVKHLDSFRHEVTVYANVQQAMCTMAIIPYQQEVLLGVLVSGSHKLIFPSSDGTSIEQTFSIE
jgi:hypothetical protein